MKHIWLGRILIGERKRNVGKFYFFHNAIKDKKDKDPFIFLFWIGRKHYISAFKRKVIKNG